MSKKIRTVFYAEEGHKTFIDRTMRAHNFKSESDTICYFIALGMQEHIKIMANEGATTHETQEMDIKA